MATSAESLSKGLEVSGGDPKVMSPQEVVFLNQFSHEKKRSPQMILQGFPPKNQGIFDNQAIHGFIGSPPSCYDNSPGPGWRNRVGGTSGVRSEIAKVNDKELAEKCPGINVILGPGMSCS